MIKKCDHAGCVKTGTHRAPKSRDLKEYWSFCVDHAGEYNKNWNFYSNMTEDEIEEDWERQTFGAPLKDVKTANKDAEDYVNLINDFITGRSRFDKIVPKKTLSLEITTALKVFNLSITTSRREIGARYRALAKMHHPDTAKNKKNAATEFTKVMNAYKVLQEYYKK